MKQGWSVIKQGWSVIKQGRSAGMVRSGDVPYNVGSPVCLNTVVTYL